MSKEELIKAVTENLLTNVERLNYGIASLSVKVHQGTVVAISHETTEVTRKQETIKGGLHLLRDQHNFDEKGGNPK